MLVRLLVSLSPVLCQSLAVEIKLSYIPWQRRRKGLVHSQGGAGPKREGYCREKDELFVGSFCEEQKGFLYDPVREFLRTSFSFEV